MHCMLIILSSFESDLITIHIHSSYIMKNVPNPHLQNWQLALQFKLFLLLDHLELQTTCHIVHKQSEDAHFETQLLIARQMRFWVWQDPILR